MQLIRPRIVSALVYLYPLCLGGFATPATSSNTCFYTVCAEPGLLLPRCETTIFATPALAIPLSTKTQKHAETIEKNGATAGPFQNSTPSLSPTRVRDLRNSMCRNAQCTHDMNSHRPDFPLFSPRANGRSHRALGTGRARACSCAF